MYDARTARIWDQIYVGGESPIRDGRAESDHILGLIRSHRPDARTLLDIGCATGRYIRYLDGALEVEGLDIDPAFLEVARARYPHVTFHEADMESFGLERRFDVITCLLATIGCVQTVERLHRTIAGFARHLSSSGLLIVEPWFTPESFWDGHVDGHYVDGSDQKVAWMHRQTREGEMSLTEMHYLVGSVDGLSHHAEQHRLGLFTDGEYRSAMEGAGLRVVHDPQGFGRGLYVAFAGEADSTR